MRKPDIKIPDSQDLFCGCDSPYEASRFVLFGAPYDGSVSFRSGARQAPAAMRRDSWSLETYSPLQDRDLEDSRVCDLGDLDLADGGTASAIDQVEDRTRSILQDEKFPIMIGGDHSLTLGSVRAALEAFPGLHLIQLDAHTDLRDSYLGDPLSHASVMRRCHDLLGDGRIHALGIRSGLREEFIFAKEHGSLYPFSLEGVRSLAGMVGRVPVYVTLDLDVLDPSFLPGTGTPEPGGVSFSELLDALEVLSSLNLVAMDLMELAPDLDPSGASTAVACKLLREWILMLSD
ncbi:MAG: agmatinase [Saccharofermentanales bacterium]|jgi:agmatinase